MNRDINVKVIYKQNNNQFPLLGLSENLINYDFMKYYLDNYRVFDKDFERKFGAFMLLDTDEDDTVSTALSIFRKEASNVILRRYKELDKIYNAYYAEENQFNPVENYFRVEVTETERSGKVSETLTGGHSTERQGKVSETLSGGHSEERVGKMTEQDTGSRDVTDTEQVKAFNADWADANKSVEKEANGNKHEVTHDNDKDVFLYDNEKKEVEHVNDKDVMTYDNEKKEVEHIDDKDKVTSKIHGNVGVSESTTILEHFVDYVKENDFMSILFTIIREELLYYSEV